MWARRQSTSCYLAQHRFNIAYTNGNANIIWLMVQASYVFDASILSSSATIGHTDLRTSYIYNSQSLMIARRLLYT